MYEIYKTENGVETMTLNTLFDSAMIAGSVAERMGKGDGIEFHVRAAKQRHYVTFTRESFATYEDWKTLCVEVRADPENTHSITIKFNLSETEVEEYC